MPDEIQAQPTDQAPPASEQETRTDTAGASAQAADALSASIGQDQPTRATARGVDTSGAPEGSGRGTDKAEKPAEPKPEKASVNWDDEANPHRAEAKRLKDAVEGTKGALKQEAAKREAAERRLAEIERTGQSEQERRSQEARLGQQWQRLKGWQAALEKADPDDAQVQAAQRDVTQQLGALTFEIDRMRQAPQTQRQVEELAAKRAGEYAYGYGRLFAEEDGLTAEEYQAIAEAESKNGSQAIVKALKAKAREKTQAELADQVEKAVTERTKALTDELAALKRAGQPRPDINNGSPRGGPNDDDAFLRRYGDGGNATQEDHVRMRKILAGYR